MPEFENLAIFAVFGAIAAFWGQVKGFLATISSFVIRQDSINSHNATKEFFEVYGPRLKIFRIGNRQIQEEWFWVQKLKYTLPFYYSLDSKLFVLLGKVPMILTPVKNGGIKFTYLYGTFSFKGLLSVLSDNIQGVELNRCQKANERKTSGFHVHDVFGNLDSLTSRLSEPTSVPQGPLSNENSKSASSSDSMFPIDVLMNYSECYGLHYRATQEKPPERLINQYFWSKEAKELLGEIEFWLKNRDWYREREMRWRRGALLYGLAGTGKSKMIEECAKKLSIPIIKLNIASMTDENFSNSYRTKYNEGQITLIEDIDVHYNGREIKSEAKSIGAKMVSFDTIINAIGGIKSSDAVFTIITTNHIEQLDSALIRAGRLDAKIEVGPLCKEGRFHVAKNILRDWPILVDKVVEESDGLVAAEFENKCIKLAIQEKNKEKYD